MAEGPEEKQKGEATLSARLEAYRVEIQNLVKNGVEHPRFEFKREWSIQRENLEDRLDFIKLMQSIANAELAAERCIIIGADPKEKSFYPVTNTAEFDAAAVSDILGKYLDPVPRFEVFNGLLTDDGKLFVLIILDAVQPRPIVVKTEGQRQNGKVRLRVGEIWIRKDTGTKIASRADIESIYRLQMEAEIEDRARKRFKHFSELPGASAGANLNMPQAPSRALLVGPASELRRFGEELFIGNDVRRFRMLLEIAREALVESWQKLNARGVEKPMTVQERANAIGDLFHDEFLPTLQALVSLGLLIVKYDFEVDWLRAIANTLIEAFDSLRGILILKAVNGLVQQSEPLPWWRPAVEIYIGFRTLAIYALMRGKLEFIGALLPQFVTRISIDNRQSLKTPFLFWPFEGAPIPENLLMDGRSTYYWKERIAASWGDYFATYDLFLNGACQLEFLLELNSYFGVNTVGDPKLKQWLESNAHDLSFIYTPDLFSYDLHWTKPVAEACYDRIAESDDFPKYLAVEPALFEIAFKGKTREQRLLIYGGFLNHLKAWQGDVMMAFRRFPFMYIWEGRLKDIYEEYKKRAPAKTRN
jgi:hypothetical protein